LKYIPAAKIMNGPGTCQKENGTGPEWIEKLFSGFINA
jgi:hypothetical protein